MFVIFKQSTTRTPIRFFTGEWFRSRKKLSREEKIEVLRKQCEEHSVSLPEEIEVLEVSEQRIHDWMDLSFRRKGRKTTLSLFDISGERTFTKRSCPIVTEDLLSWIEELNSHPAPIPSASFRVRVNHHGQRGIWIDASTIDQRALLNQKRWLLLLREKAHVEMGPKRMYVEEQDDTLLLDRAMLRPWFTTPLERSDREAVLWTVAGGFTQPSLKLNRTLVHRVMRQCHTSEAQSWAELGAGCGNFTLPLADAFSSVCTTETNLLARDGLELSISKAGLDDRVSISRLNLQRNTVKTRALLSDVDGLLVDPPQGGLQGALETLAECPAPPKQLVYVSSVGSAIAKDSAALGELGYALEHIEGLNQFPTAAKCQWLLRFARH